MPSLIVLGAGLAGLSAAHHLGGRCEVFEKEHYLGGHARTKRVEGFNFDEGAHVFFGTDECSQKFVWQPLGTEMIDHEAEIWNHYDGRRFGRYPVQVNAAALDPALATECVKDFIEAAQHPEREVQNYQEWCYASFGRAFADNFMLRYARKVWTVEPNELTTEWLGTAVGRRIARPPLEQVLRGAIDKQPVVLNYLTRFSYPARGGFGRLTDPIGAGICVRTGCQLLRVVPSKRKLLFADGSERQYDAAISTVPLPAFVGMCEDAPSDVKEASAELMWTSIRCVNLGVAREDVGPGHWTYFYDDSIPFFRISFPSKFAPDNAPPGMGSISCEIAYSRRRPLGPGDLTTRVREALLNVGVLREDDRIVIQDQIDVPFAYVVFDHNRAVALDTIHTWMRDHGIYPCGRFGEWGYHWSFEAIESGRRVAALVSRDLGLQS